VCVGLTGFSGLREGAGGARAAAAARSGSSGGGTCPTARDGSRARRVSGCPDAATRCADVLTTLTDDIPKDTWFYDLDINAQWPQRQGQSPGFTPVAPNLWGCYRVPADSMTFGSFTRCRPVSDRRRTIAVDRASGSGRLKTRAVVAHCRCLRRASSMTSSSASLPDRGANDAHLALGLLVAGVVFIWVSIVEPVRWTLGRRTSGARAHRHDLARAHGRAAASPVFLRKTASDLRARPVWGRFYDVPKGQDATALVQRDVVGAGTRAGVTVLTVVPVPRIEEAGLAGYGIRFSTSVSADQLKSFMDALRGGPRFLRMSGSRDRATGAANGSERSSHGDHGGLRIYAE